MVVREGNVWEDRHGKKADVKRYCLDLRMLCYHGFTCAAKNPTISEATQKKIADIAKELGYIPN